MRAQAHIRHLELRRDIDLRDSGFNERLEFLRGQSGAPVQDDRLVRQCPELPCSLRKQFRTTMVNPVGSAQLRGDQVDATRLGRLDDLLRAVGVRNHIGADTVFNADDVLDLGLDADAVSMCQLGYLPRFADRRLQIAVRRIEQHGRPARRNHVLDDTTIRAVIQMQGDRYPRIGYRGVEHGCQQPHSDRLRRLHRRLNDHR